MGYIYYIILLLGLSQHQPIHYNISAFLFVNVLYLIFCSFIWVTTVFPLPAPICICNIMQQYLHCLETLTGEVHFVRSGSNYIISSVPETVFSHLKEEKVDSSIQCHKYQLSVTDLSFK